MATIKIKFRISSLKTKEGTVFFQIIHNRMVRQINTGYKIFPSEWDRYNAQIILPVEISDVRRSYLITLKNKIKSRMSQLANIISELEKSGKPFTSDLIVMTYHQIVLSDGFLTFIRNQILVYKKTGKFSASEKLQAALNSFILFHGEEELLFGEIDAPLMEAYEAFLKNRGICMNTISFYMRVLRSVYNKAVMQGMSVQQYPFQTVYTGIGKKIGLNIPLTTYVARHGWASIAYGACIPTATISEALGHDSEKTTRIYLASLDTSAVDRANSQILRSL